MKWIKLTQTNVHNNGAWLTLFCLNSLVFVRFFVCALSSLPHLFKRSFVLCYFLALVLRVWIFVGFYFSCALLQCNVVKVKHVYPGQYIFFNQTVFFLCVHLYCVRVTVAVIVCVYERESSRLLYIFIKYILIHDFFPLSFRYVYYLNHTYYVYKSVALALISRASCVLTNCFVFV